MNIKKSLSLCLAVGNFLCMQIWKRKVMHYTEVKCQFPLKCETIWIICILTFFPSKSSYSWVYNDLYRQFWKQTSRYSLAIKCKHWNDVELHVLSPWQYQAAISLKLCSTFEFDTSFKKKLQCKTFY